MSAFRGSLFRRIQTPVTGAYGARAFARHASVCSPEDCGQPQTERETLNCFHWKQFATRAGGCCLLQNTGVEQPPEFTAMSPGHDVRPERYVILQNTNCLVSGVDVPPNPAHRDLARSLEGKEQPQTLSNATLVGWFRRLAMVSCPKHRASRGSPVNEGLALLTESSSRQPPDGAPTGARSLHRW
jgi:hypothetical protein